jgi:hypothetical protein
MISHGGAHIDTSRRVEIRASPWRMLRMAGLGMLMTAMSAVVGFRMIDNVPDGGLGQFAGLVGIFFFGLCTVIIFKRFLTVRGAVVTLGPEGIRDDRIARAFIPWTAIRRIGTWESYGQKVMVLEIDPLVEAKLPLARAVTWTREANRRLGVNGLGVSAQGLDVSYDTLLAMTTAYAEAARPA